MQLLDRCRVWRITCVESPLISSSCMEVDGTIAANVLVIIYSGVCVCVCV